MVEYSPPNNIQDEVLTFLLSSPTPAQIIAFRASEEAQDRLRYLLDANREGTLTPEENAELKRSQPTQSSLYAVESQSAPSTSNLMVDHLFMIPKAC